MNDKNILSMEETDDEGIVSLLYESKRTASLFVRSCLISIRQRSKSAVSLKFIDTMYLVSRFQKFLLMLLFFVMLIFRFILVGKGLLFIYTSNSIILVVCVNTMFTVFRSVTAS